MNEYVVTEDRVLVKPDEAPGIRPSGLVLPQQSQEKPQTGIVLAVGPGRYSDTTGVLIPVDLYPDDVVMYSKYGGTEIEIDDETLLILSAKDIFARID